MVRSSILLGRRVAAAVLVAGLLAASPVVAREKIDVIRLNNGDRVTGEITTLEQGSLTLKTDNMGTIVIEWIAVHSIDSPQQFEVEDDDGERYFGTITEADEEGRFAIVTMDGMVPLAADRLVRMAQIEKSWVKRWGGYVDFGYNFTSANTATDSSVSAEANYRSRRFSLTNSLSATLSDRDDAPQAQYGTVSSTYQRLLQERWFWLGGFQLTRNTELDLDLRATFAAGVGRYLIQRSWSQLQAGVGVSANRERYLSAGKSEWTSEGSLFAEYDIFLFEGPETKLSFEINLLPSFTTSGRYRAELDSSFRRKLVRDFTFSLGASYSYDSKPPTETAESEDLRFQTTLGWTF